VYVALVTHPEALTLTFAETFEALTSGAGGPRGTFWTGAVLIGWGMTTFMMTNALVFEIKQAMIEGMIKYCASVWNIYDLLRILPLLTANLLLLTRGAWAGESAPADAVVALYAMSIVFFAFRAISFFRGSLKFATLVYSIGVIMSQIQAFLVILGVLFIGFSMALWLLMRSVENVPPGCAFRPRDGVLPDGVDPCITKYEDYTWFMAASLAMALFGEAPNEETPASIFLAESVTNTQPPLIKATFYLAFNFIMQVVLLNLLIALMGEARASALQEANYNAYRRRAELVLEQEQLQKEVRRKQVKRQTRAQARSPLLRCLCWPCGLGRLCDLDAWWGDESDEREALEERWLHVIIPDEKVDMLRDTKHGDAAPDE